jgi:protein O-GlcNAc transferase
MVDPCCPQPPLSEMVLCCKQRSGCHPWRARSWSLHLSQALGHYRKALIMMPTNQLALANLVYIKTKLCSWINIYVHRSMLHDAASRLLARVAARGHSDPAPHLFLPPYHALAYGGRFKPLALRALAAAYAQRAVAVAGMKLSWHAWYAETRAADLLTGRRLRVGYLSTDFGEHPTSHLMRSVWLLQRARGEVHAICFARSPSDLSEQRRYIERTCEEFIDLSAMSWLEAATTINLRRVHILVDLNGHCGRRADKRVPWCCRMLSTPQTELHQPRLWRGATLG